MPKFFLNRGLSIKKRIFQSIAVCFFLGCVGQIAHAQVSDAIKNLKNKFEKNLRDAVPAKSEKATKDKAPPSAADDHRMHESISVTQENEGIKDKNFDREDTADDKNLAEPKHDGWKKLSLEQKKAIREFAGPAHTVYVNGIKKHFLASFKSCEKGVNEAIYDEAKKIRESALNLDSKKEIEKKQIEAENTIKNAPLIMRVHCLGRTMFSLASMKSGMDSPLIDDWIKHTKGLDYEDFTEVAIKKINVQLEKKHENFVQGDIQLLKLSEQQKRALKNRANLGSDDVSAAGSIRLQSYLSSYTVLLAVLGHFPLEFGCKPIGPDDPTPICD